MAIVPAPLMAGKKNLSSRIPRPLGNFHPQITRHTPRPGRGMRSGSPESFIQRGLLQEQVSDVCRNQIYGRRTTPSRRSAVWWNCSHSGQWNGLKRGLEEYYPVVFVTAVHIKIQPQASVASEAFYGHAVTEEGHTRGSWHLHMPQGKRHG